MIYSNILFLLYVIKALSIYFKIISYKILLLIKGLSGKRGYM